MIHRILIPIILLVVLPYLWIDRRELRQAGWRKRCLLWCPAVLLLGYSIYLAMLPDFVPKNPLLIDIWFGMMSVCAIPQLVYALCSGIGRCCQHWLKVRKNYGRKIGFVLSVVAFLSFVYGFTWGFQKMEVKHLTIYVPDLPKNFDGYRIVQFSDIHMGSYYGWRKDIPQRDIDSIQAQHADMICFTGDLQNAYPSELPPYRKLLSSLKARDGVYSILGNHDYSYYVSSASPEEKVAIEQQVQDYERSLGWHLLNNQHVVVRRGQDSIFVAGTENYDKPKRTSVAKALHGIKPGNFILMLQHIPTQWKKMTPSTINEEYGSKDSVLVAPQLTLSGHTHAGQIEILGLRPTLFAPYDYGLYEREGCQLYTTAGLGGVIPIRIGATAEIVVITLKCKR